MVIRTAVWSATILAAAYAQPGPHGRGPAGPVGPGPRLIGAEAGMPRRVVKNAPFSAEIVTETTQALADGNRIKRTNTVKVYRDSEGRTRREQSLRNLNGLGAGAGSSGPAQVAFINDPVAGTSYALDLANRTATKSGWHGRDGTGASPDAAPGNGAGPRPGMRARDSQNVRTESLGKQNIEGVVAEGTRTTLTIPAGEIGNEQAMQVVDETWYSAELQTAVLRKHSDPRSGETVTRYMNITRADPPRTLFEPPADFKVSERRGRANQ